MPHTLSSADEITRALRDDILRGQYRAGARVPSERDLAARFATSQGTVREALKKVEQLGVASIQPGGARVVPLQECTLDVLRPLLELNEIPDAELMGQVLGIGNLLIGYAAETAVERGDPAGLVRVEAVIDQIFAAGPRDLAQMRVPRLALGGSPRLDPKALKRVAADLKAAVAQRVGAPAGSTMRELMARMRAAARETLRSHRTNANETPFSHRPNAKETNS